MSSLLSLSYSGTNVVEISRTTVILRQFFFMHDDIFSKARRTGTAVPARTKPYRHSIYSTYHFNSLATYFHYIKSLCKAYVLTLCSTVVTVETSSVNPVD